jgi:hypothetical protein
MPLTISAPQSGARWRVMNRNSSQPESVDGEPGSSVVFHAFATAISLAAICATPAMSADWDLARPGSGLRMPDSFLSLRDMYPDLATPRTAFEFTREFQPRASVFPVLSPDADFRSSSLRERSGDLPLTTAWQRMGDFRSQTGVRLLTVWQSADSTLALHQGKHGEASLQWTSHAMNRGGASRGLFDHLMSTVHDVHIPVHTQVPGAPALSMPISSRFATP